MFVINLHLAHRLLPCVSTEQTRYYLNGVGIHLLEHGARLVATDSHIMGVFRDHEAHGTHDGIAIVSRHAIVDAFKAAKKEARRNPANYWLVVADNGMAHVILAPTALCAMSGRDDDDDKECQTLWRSVKSVLVDGTFPDYVRVIPSQAFDVAPSRYGWNPELLGRFASVIEISAKGPARGASLISGSADGNGPWFVLSAAVPDFVGIAMPMRNGTDNSATLVAAARDVLDRNEAGLSFVPQTKVKADA